MREPKAGSSSFASTMSKKEGIFDSVSAHLLATAANIFWWAGDPTEEEQHFPTSYEGTHACTHAILGLSSNTWNKRMPHDSSFLFVGQSVARKSRQRW